MVKDNIPHEEAKKRAGRIVSYRAKKKLADRICQYCEKEFIIYESKK